MTQKAKKYLIITVICVALLFIWIFVAVFLTGGRDIPEFTAQDKRIMTVFVITEIVTCIVTFVFAGLAGRENRANIPQIQKMPKTKSEKVISNRGLGMMIVSYVLALGMMIVGIVVGKNTPDKLQNICQWTLGICCVIAAALLLINILLQKRYVRRLERQQVGRLQQFIISHRETAEQTASQKQVFIKKWRRLTDLYALVFGILGLCVAFCAGVAYDSGSSAAYCLIAGLLFMGTLSRIRFRTPKSVFDENKTYVSQEEFPRLYGLVKRAADTIGCSGEFKIALLPDNNAGIAKLGEIISIQLGVVLLKTLSEEEVYHILLHEFSHMAQEKTIAWKERDYYNWLNYGRTPHFFSGITNVFFLYFDTVYTFQFGLYQYAASIQIETEADQAMARCGNREAAVSALLKIQYYDLFCWEKGAADEICLYTEEQPDKQLLTREINRFHEAIGSRADDWNRLVSVEILSRSASHPTMKMRLETLGVNTPKIMGFTDSSDYTKECDRALVYMEELVYEDRLKSYEENRKSYYLEPKAQVTAWEEAGRPVVAEEYADIVWALRQLGRTKDAIELCQRAIDTLPHAASHQGYFIRGCYQLYRYDEAGLEDIYFAIENNNNYIDEGLSVIGAFCCLTGNQKELDIYRERAVEIAQKDKDEYSQVRTLNKNDRLSCETLPDGMLADILEYIRSVDKDSNIDSIYLVRKTITDNFFTSAFVVRFDEKAEEVICNEILHKIFCYLDTCSDWQFSLFAYPEVARVKVEKIENSCVYSKKTLV